MSRLPFVSVVLPCLNEAGTIGQCVRSASLFSSTLPLSRSSTLNMEVIVADNGSTDGSQAIARKAGAKVISVAERGYGYACLAGLWLAKGNWLVIGDADGTYDFREIGRLLAELNDGADIVLGSRMKGKISKGAMPVLNRYLGTPVLNFLLRLIYKVTVSDSQTGFRAMTRKTLDKLGLKAGGMEFASEMLVGASRLGLKVTEVGVSYSPRQSPSKLSLLRDGWRHLRLILSFSGLTRESIKINLDPPIKSEDDRD